MVSETARWAWTYARMRQLYLTVKRDPKRTEYKTLRLRRSPRTRSRPTRCSAPTLPVPTSIRSAAWKKPATAPLPEGPIPLISCAIHCFPAHTAFPKWQEGRHPHCHFRGLLRLHSRYGPPDRSAAHRRPLSRGSNPRGYPHEPLVSYRINRQLSGWILPPLMIRAFGAHCQ